MRRRWLPDFPNYDRARPVQETSASIGEDAFGATFVRKHRPCVIRGAASPWPATRRWTVEHFRSRARASNEAADASLVDISLEPIPEEDALNFRPRTYRVTLSEFLDLVCDRERPFVQAYYVPASLLGGLSEDTLQLPFMDTAGHPPRQSFDRLFLGRAGYTDWHVHSADETLTVQLQAKKELLLLPPDQQTYDAMLPVAKRGVWKLPPSCWEGAFARLVPWKVTLFPGDVLYVPMNWWHVAEASDDEFNVTLARPFRTPLEWLADLRLPNVRRCLQLGALHAIRSAVASRSLRPIVDASRLALLTTAAFPLSLLGHPARRPW
jgi:Cupin-like domain